MKQENQLSQIITLILEADREAFPDRWDSTHELYHERDLERSEIHDKAKAVAEAEICEHLGIPDLESQMFSAAESQRENSTFSEDEPEAQLETEPEATGNGRSQAPEAEYIILDESESELEIEPELESSTVLESSTERACEPVPESNPASPRESVGQGLVEMTAVVAMRSREKLTETAGFVNPDQRAVHEQRWRSSRRETPNTRLRRLDQELIRGLGAV